MAALDLLPLGAGLIDFADTAALIANLDLVISVDTATGQAMLGIAARFPLRMAMTGRVLDTPWYPGAMRLCNRMGGL